MTFVSEILAILGLSQKQMHKVSDKRQVAGKLIAETSALADELYFMIDQDFHDFGHLLDGEDKEVIEDALSQASYLRKMSEEHFKMLQEATTLSLKKWDNLLQHMERQHRSTVRVRDWYKDNIHEALASQGRLTWEHGRHRE